MSLEAKAFLLASLCSLVFFGMKRDQCETVKESMPQKSSRRQEKSTASPTARLDWVDSSLYNQALRLFKKSPCFWASKAAWNSSSHEPMDVEEFHLVQFSPPVGLPVVPQKRDDERCGDRAMWTPSGKTQRRRALWAQTRSPKKQLLIVS